MGSDVEDLRCSFCGKQKSEVWRLISGQQGMICDVCVRRLAEPVAERGTPRRASPGRVVTEAEFASMVGPAGVPMIALDDFDLEQEVLGLFSSEVARRYRCIPINRAGASLIVALADPADRVTISALRTLVGTNVEVVEATAEAIERALDRYYPG